MVNRVKPFLDEKLEAWQHDDFYELDAYETYIVSLATALHVERMLDSINQPEWIAFQDLFGARHRIRLQTVGRITESTRQSRSAARAFEQAREKEEKDDKDPLQDLLA